MTTLNEKVKTLSKQMGFLKLYLKKQMKALRIKKEALVKNPSLIPPPMVKSGLCGSKPLNFRELNNELEGTFKSMDEFG